MSEFEFASTCFSGGAKGADQLFGECAEAVGHAVVHWTFGEHFSPCRKELIVRLGYTHLMKADPYLIEANALIKRQFPTRSEYVNNLLRRNFYQVFDNDRLYAVTALNPDGIPFGGTAWAIVMGYNLGMREMYVFDTVVNVWKSFERKNGNRYEWNEHWDDEDIPFPKGRYAGIGSSELPESGAISIRKLYGL